MWNFEFQLSLRFTILYAIMANITANGWTMGDVVIYLLFNWGHPYHIGFFKNRNVPPHRIRRLRMPHSAKSLRRFAYRNFSIFKMAAVRLAVLDLLGTYLDHSHRVVVHGLIVVKQLAGIGEVVSVIWKFSILRVWLENVCSCPRSCGFWDFLIP